MENQECPDCHKYEANWILCVGKFWSEIEQKRVTTQLYQCIYCKRLFTVPQLESTIGMVHND